ncbi:hypothetical protein HY932_01215 [Candidatus Falkowbacteria bacterium]|nr:hypothetical protein [Candidatus Falkowbacteria bacterium]
MKKVMILLISIAIVFCFSGCAKKADFNFYNFEMSKSEIAKAVKGWDIYTNGTWRFEMRFPTDWNVKKVDEWSKEVYFIPKDKQAEFNVGNYKGVIYIKGVMNFQTKYDLAKYMDSVGRKEILGGTYQQLQVKVGGQDAILIKNAEEFYSVWADELLINLGDRILDIFIYDKTPDVLAALNSMTFYGDVVKDIE